MIDTLQMLDGRGLARALIALRLSDTDAVEVQEQVLRTYTDQGDGVASAETVLYALLHSCDWVAGLMMSQARQFDRAPEDLFSDMAIRFEARRIPTD